MPERDTCLFTTSTGRSLSCVIFRPLGCSVSFFFFLYSLELNNRHHGGGKKKKKEETIILHVPVFLGFNRLVSTAHHSNSVPGVEEKIKIVLSLCQM